MNRSVWQKQHCPPDLMYTKWSEATNPPHSMCLGSKPNCSHRTPNRSLHILPPDQAVSATEYWYPVWPQYVIACSSFSVHSSAPWTTRHTTVISPFPQERFPQSAIIYRTRTKPLPMKPVQTWNPHPKNGRHTRILHQKRGSDEYLLHSDNLPDTLFLYLKAPLTAKRNPWKKEV